MQNEKCADCRHVGLHIAGRLGVASAVRGGALLLLFLAASAAAVWAAPGDLDPTFGTGGNVVNFVGAGSSGVFGQGLAVQSNAMCESFFATLECELLDRHRFPTQAAARLAVFEYIEGWYSPHRRHSALDYGSPVNYERSLSLS